MAPIQRPPWLTPNVQCQCGGGGRIRTMPLRIFSTAAEAIRRLGGVTGDVGTWRCGRCGTVQTVTAAHLGFAVST